MRTFLSRHIVNKKTVFLHGKKKGMTVRNPIYLHKDHACLGFFVKKEIVVKKKRKHESRLRRRGARKWEAVEAFR